MDDLLTYRRPATWGAGAPKGVSTIYVNDACGICLASTS
jgi:hypothetical protein